MSDNRHPLRVAHTVGGMDSDPDATPELTWGLTGYVRAVAELVGVPGDGTSLEISDTVTAYLGLARHAAGLPNRDLMLVWSEQYGWLVAAETGPAEAPIVLGYFGGDELVPEPRFVARFVAKLVAGSRSGNHRPVFQTPADRERLTEKLRCYGQFVS